MNIKRLVWNSQKMFQIKPYGESDMSPTYVIRRVRELCEGLSVVTGEDSLSVEAQSNATMLFKILVSFCSLLGGWSVGLIEAMVLCFGTGKGCRFVEAGADGLKLPMCRCLAGCLSGRTACPIFLSFTSCCKCLSLAWHNTPLAVVFYLLHVQLNLACILSLA